MIFNSNNNNPQSGFGAFAYILMSIALLAALTAAISIGGRNNSRLQNNDILASKIYGQASKIRSDILLCMTEAPTQNSTVGPSAYTRFPACGSVVEDTYSESGYCTNTGSASPFAANARNLKCLTPSSDSVWDNSEGNFFPELITGFEEWKYYIQTAADYRGVSLMITSTDRNPNQDIDWVLRKVRERFGPNEAQVLIRPVGNGGDDAAGVVTMGPCADAALCNTLQVWLAR